MSIWLAGFCDNTVGKCLTFRCGRCRLDIRGRHQSHANGGHGAGLDTRVRKVADPMDPPAHLKGAESEALMDAEVDCLLEEEGIAGENASVEGLLGASSFPCPLLPGCFLRSTLLKRPLSRQPVRSPPPHRPRPCRRPSCRGPFGTPGCVGLPGGSRRRFWQVLR